MTLRTFSYGGGVQSTAALVLAAQGKIDYKTFLFANVGEDSFEQAVALEERLNEKRESFGKDNIYLHPSVNPLDQAVGIQYTLFEDDPCDSGYCFV